MNEHILIFKEENSSKKVTFTSPEAAMPLVCARNQGLWPLPISEHAQSTHNFCVFSQSDLSYLTMSP